MSTSRTALGHRTHCSPFAHLYPRDRHPGPYLATATAGPSAGLAIAMNTPTAVSAALLYLPKHPTESLLPFVRSSDRISDFCSCVRTHGQRPEVRVAHAEHIIGPRCEQVGLLGVRDGWWDEGLDHDPPKSTQRARTRSGQGSKAHRGTGRARALGAAGGVDPRLGPCPFGSCGNCGAKA